MCFEGGINLREFHINRKFRTQTQRIFVKTGVGSTALGLGMRRLKMACQDVTPLVEPSATCSLAMFVPKEASKNLSTEAKLREAKNTESPTAPRSGRPWGCGSPSLASCDEPCSEGASGLIWSVQPVLAVSWEV